MKLRFRNHDNQESWSVKKYSRCEWARTGGGRFRAVENTSRYAWVKTHASSQTFTSRHTANKQLWEYVKLSELIHTHVQMIECVKFSRDVATLVVVLYTHVQTIECVNFAIDVTSIEFTLDTNVQMIESINRVSRLRVRSKIESTTQLNVCSRLATTTQQQTTIQQLLTLLNNYSTTIQQLLTLLNNY